MLTDSFGRAINYLRISVTDRCNLRCAYCMPAGKKEWISRTELLTDDEILRIVIAGVQLGLRKIRITGGEPLVRPGLVQLIRRIALIPGIEDISLTTNAILLEKMATPLAEAGLRRVNISLDTLDADKFRQVTRAGDISRVWRGILAAEIAGLFPLKVNTVVVNGFNSDELCNLASLTIDHPWHLRFIELMPIGSGEQDWGPDLPVADGRYLSVQQMHSRLSAFNLQPVDTPLGNGPARTFYIPGARGTLGFISPLGDHFCQDCNRLRLTADGRLRACLLKTGEVSLRQALTSGADLAPLIQQAVQLKPAGHMLSGEMHPVSPNLSMNSIGG